MATTPSIIKGYHISYAPYSATEPEDGAWIEIKNTIRALPNFFPDPDTIDTSTVDNTMPTSIAGWSSGEAYGFTVAPTTQFMAALKAMISDQQDDEKGYFWLRVDITNRNQRLTGKFTTVDYLPTPEGNAGDLDEVTWNVYAVEDLKSTDIPSA